MLCLKILLYALLLACGAQFIALSVCTLAVNVLLDRGKATMLRGAPLQSNPES